MSEEFKVDLKVELDESSLQSTEQRIKDIGKNTKVKVNVEINDNDSAGKANSGIKQIEQSAKRADSSTKSFGDTLKRSLNIGSAAAITAKGIRMIESAAKDAVTAVKDIDGAITDLRIATGDSYKNVQNLIKGYNQLGQAMGATTTEVTDSADAWLRQGNSVKETNILIRDSMILSKVGQIDSADATKYLTSAMKGYGVAVEEVLGIVDKLTAVDLVSATDAGGLAEAMSRTAETADMAGVSMDKLLGYLATVGETTQKSMSSIGESFKTIFTRMADIKADKLELIDEDGTTETLSQVETVLNNLGIKLRNSDNEFRNFGDVLDEVASGWENYSSVQQAAISKAFAGTRQSENFKVLMENYDVARQYMETAANSAGTAEQKFGAYLDSIEAKTKSLQAAFESLSVNTFSTEMLGGIIEASTAVIKFIDNTNLLKGSLAGLAAAGAIKGFTVMATGISNAAIKLNEFNAALKLVKMGNLETDEISKLASLTVNLSQSQLKAVLSSKALTTQQRLAILTSQGMSQAEAQATLSTMGLASAEGTATATTFSLSGAIKGLWATLMANPLILVVAGVTAAVSAYSTFKQKVEEAKQAQLDVGNAAKDSASDIIELYNAYSTANAAYESNSGSKQNLESATDSLLSALGVEESQIQKLKEEYGGLDEAINQVTMDSLKDKLSELTSGYQASIDKLLDTTKDGWFSSFSMLDFYDGDNTKKFASVLEKAGLIDSGSYGSKGGSIYLGDNSSIEGVIEMYQKLIDMREAFENAIANGEIDRPELVQSDLYKSINDKINSFENEYKDTLDYINKINDVAAQLQYMDIVKTDGVPQSKEQFDVLKQSMIDTAAENKNFVGSQEQINDAITNTLSDIPELSQFYDDMGNSTEEAVKATKEQLESLKSTFKENDISDWFDSLSDDDKQLVYQISVKSDDTTLWTLSKWKQELADMSAAGKTSEESLQSFYDVMNNTEDGNFSDKVNDYLDKVQSLKDALTKIDTGELTDTEKVSLALDFPELAGHTGDIDSLRAAIASLIDTSNQGINEEIDSQIKALGGDGTAAASALESLREMLNAIGNTSGWNFDIDAEIEKFNNLYDAMKESVSGTGLSTEGIKNVEAMFSGLKGYDPSVLFERTEHGIHLNTTALRALQSQYESTTKLGIQERLQDLKQEYNDSAKAVEGLTKGTEAYNKALSDKGLRSTDDILADIENVQTLAAQYEGLTSAYNKWVMAQSAGEEGDMYDNITGSLEDIKKLYDDGLVGTNAFRSAVQMMTNEDLSTANIDKLISVYESGYPTMQKYFQDSSDGCINFLKDVESLNSEWAHMNSDGSWDINFGIGNDEEIAKAISDMTGLQMSTEEVQILMRKLSDYGFDIKLDSAYTSVDELKSKIEETEGKLKELGQEPVDIDVNATDAEAELEKAKGKIQEINDSDASVEVKTAQLDDAYAKIDVLVAKVNQPAFMTIDASQVDSELQGSLGTLQEYQNAVNNLNALQIKGADTSEIEAAKGKVDELAGKIKDLPAETKTKIGLEADDSVEDIKSKISSGDVKIPVSADTSQAETEISSIDGQDVKVNVTTSGNEAIDNLKSAIDGIKDKNVTITATAVGKDSIEGLKTATTNLTNKNVTATATPVGKDGVDALKKSIDSLYNRTVTSTAKVVGTNLVVALKTAIDNLYNKTVSVGANVFGTAAVRSLKSAIDSLYSKTVTATTVTKKVAGVDGTAHANGTAFAQGDWGTKENGVALGGELGQELVVRNGKFFTIGDKSAEFFKYQKGDIIFNAAQTKEIFEKGKITHGTGRGKALAEGTAFSSGSGRFTSGGKTKHTTSGGGGRGSSKSGGGSSGGKSSSSSSSSSKDDKETFDWIETAIDRLERAISRLDLKANSVYKSWGTRNSALKSQISEIGNEIDLQSKGYNRYIQQAKSVGLSADWAKKVREGKVDIDTISDKNLQDKIKEYQEWYEKALDCKDAIEELKETQAELYKTAFDNVATKYEGILGVIDHEKSMLDEYISQSEAKGYITSANYYKAQISAEKKNIKELQNEKANLLTALQNGVNSGTIKQGSEAWYEMVNQIDDVTLSIEQANTTVLELNKSIREVDWQVFDLLQERISYITTEADFLINLMENDKLYDDKGQLTNEGKSTMGLHGVNYNVYMAQADKYAQEIAKIDKDLAKDPYNQDLAQRRQELLELQQEMILAAEDEKEAIRDMVKEGIELELDALQELIDKYTDALDRQKDLYDYQKKVAEQTKEIASIEKQMSAYEGDDSEETKAKIQKLKVSLEDAKSDLEDTQYDKYISDQKQLLDDLYNEYETILNQRLDNLDALITDMIGQINTNAGTISTTLSEKADSVGYTLSESMTTIWDTNSTKITTVLTTYGQNIQNGISSAATTVNSAIGMINTNLATMMVV
ncbi:phage tail tape measure protein [Blautia stercoris]